jgi:hypothetical protein
VLSTELAVLAKICDIGIGMHIKSEKDKKFIEGYIAIK